MKIIISPAKKLTAEKISINKGSSIQFLHEAKYLVEQLKTRNILLSLDGPFNNVLKIKPPIVFNQSNVDYFIAQLKDCLAHL